MKNDKLLFRSSILLLLIVLFAACQKEPEQIIEISDDSILKLHAGSVKGYKDGPALDAQFTEPTHIAAGPDKSLYVVDNSRNDPVTAVRFSTRIRKIDPNGIVSTFFDLEKSDQGVKRVNGIAVDKKGYVYFSDESQIKKISPDGKNVTLVAGDGSRDLMKDGKALSASFYEPSGLVFDKNECLYIMDSGNNAIRLYSNGKVSTLAGGNRIYQDKCDYQGCTEDNQFINGTGKNAYFDFPQYITVDEQLNVYVSGGRWHIIRKITPAGVVTTFFDFIYFMELGADFAYKGITYYQGNLYVNDVRTVFPSPRWASFSTDRISLKGDSTRLFFNDYHGDFSTRYLPIENGLNFPSGNVVMDDVIYIANTDEHTIRKIALE